MTSPALSRRPGRGAHWLRWPALAAALALYALLLWGLDRAALMVASEAYRTPEALLLNAAVGAPMVLLLWAATRRPCASVLLVLVVQALMYKASGVKLQVLGAPLALQDIYFFTTFNRASLELFSSYLQDAGAFWAWAAGAVLLVAAAFWMERPGARRLSPAGCIIAGAGVMLALSLYLAAWPWAALYTRQSVRPSSLEPVPAVLRAGLMSSLVYKHLERTNTVHSVDEQALRRLLELTAEERAAAAAPVASGPAPDVVMVLSESFMDPRQLSGMDRFADPVPGLRGLLEQGAGGGMIVPTYGGGTVRTEFEALTGMPVSAFASVMYPYVDMSLQGLPSLPGLLRERGYDTVAIHGNSGAFWSRSDTYRGIGIERFLTEDDFQQAGVRDGLWYSDASMTDLLLQELDAADAPLFVMAISIENHGPYNSQAPVLDEAARHGVPLPEGMDPPVASTLRKYLYHLRNADRQLVRLLEHLRQRGRPFVLVLFGDHLPALPDVYNVLPFANGRQAEQQTVPWLIVGDGSRQAHGRSLHSWELGAEALSLAGIADDPYFNLVRVAGRRLSTLPPDSSEAAALRRGVEAAAVARLSGRFEEFLE